MPTSAPARPRNVRLAPPLLAARTAAALTAAAICLAPQVAAAKPTAPQLSIAVDNGHTSAAAGDRLSYTVTVTNLGGAAIDNLWVTQTVPAGARFDTADAQGKRRAGEVTWRVKLKASGKAVVHTTMTVSARTPKELLRVATVACAKVALKGPPLVCAADSDQLPAGAAAQAATARAATSGGVWTRSRAQLAGAGAVAVAVTLLLAFLTRRRKA